MESTEKTQAPEVVAQAEENHEKKTPQESFAELRKAREDAERQAWQAKKELELVQAQIKSQQMQQPQVPQEPDFDFSQLAQDDYVEGKKLVKAFGSIDKKLSGYEQKLAEKEAKIKALEFAQDHPDFKDVVTAENIEKYIKSDEDNLESVNNSANPLRKVYNLIKKSASYQTDKTAKEKPISQEQRRVDEKDSKPKTESIGVRSAAVTTAAKWSDSSMSKKEKLAIWAETQALARK